jgi:uncharacterized Zn finger protein (UPF0148 family)
MAKLLCSRCDTYIDTFVEEDGKVQCPQCGRKFQFVSRHAAQQTEGAELPREGDEDPLSEEDSTKERPAIKGAKTPTKRHRLRGWTLLIIMSGLLLLGCMVAAVIVGNL